MSQIAPIVESQPKNSGQIVVTLGATIAALYFGAEILVPIALAILLSFALAPGVRLLHRLHLGRVAPVLLMTLIAFCAIFALAGIMAIQVKDLASEAPRYETTIRQKIDTLHRIAAGAGLQHAMDVIANMSEALHPDNSAATAAKVEAGSPGQPLTVVIQRPPPTPMQTLTEVLSPLLHPVSTLGIVVVFVMFILLQREDLRNRLIRLFGAGDLHRSTAALDDAARRLSRFLLAQLGLNTAAGLTIGCALGLFGVPSPILWGILFGTLRFVPYVGPPLAAILPIALAAAVDPGWTLALSTLGLFVIIEAVIGQVLEPLLYGHNTGLSPVAIVIAATFWTALWGPIGLILSTPMTVCLVVLGRHVDHLTFLDVLLGDRPPLSMPEIFYQRMLAGDPIEASDQAEKCLRTMGLVDYYDTVVMPALRLAQDDVSQGRLDVERQRRIGACVEEVVEDLAEELIEPEQKSRSAMSPHAIIERFTHRHAKDDPITEMSKAQEDEIQALPSAAPEHAASPEPKAPAQKAPAWSLDHAVFCVGGRGPLDDVAARIMTQVLIKHGFGATAASHDMLLKSNVVKLDLTRSRLICISCFEGTSSNYMGFLVRRLRRRAPSAKIFVGAWWRGGESQPDGPIADILQETAVGTIADALVYCEGQALDWIEQESPKAVSGAVEAVS